jgi:hypothetical protein
MPTSSSGASENADEQATVTEPITNTNKDQPVVTIPPGAIAVIVIVLVLIIGASIAVVCFKVVYKRHEENALLKKSPDTANEQDKEASSNLL